MKNVVTIYYGPPGLPLLKVKLKVENAENEDSAVSQAMEEARFLLAYPGYVVSDVEVNK